jgi:hypothetical protein
MGRLGHRQIQQEPARQHLTLRIRETTSRPSDRVALEQALELINSRLPEPLIESQRRSARSRALCSRSSATK